MKTQHLSNTSSILLISLLSYHAKTSVHQAQKKPPLKTRSWLQLNLIRWYPLEIGRIQLTIHNILPLHNHSFQIWISLQNNRQQIPGWHLHFERLKETRNRFLIHVKILAIQDNMTAHKVTKTHLSTKNNLINE